MKLGDKLIVAGAVLIPAAITVACAIGAIVSLFMHPYSPGIDWGIVGAFAASLVASLVVTATIGLITARILLRKQK